MGAADPSPGATVAWPRPDHQSSRAPSPWQRSPITGSWSRLQQRDRQGPGGDHSSPPEWPCPGRDGMPGPCSPVCAHSPFLLEVGAGGALLPRASCQQEGWWPPHSGLDGRRQGASRSLGERRLREQALGRASHPPPHPPGRSQGHLLVWVLGSGGRGGQGCGGLELAGALSRPATPRPVTPLPSQVVRRRPYLPGSQQWLLFPARPRGAGCTGRPGSGGQGEGPPLRCPSGQAGGCGDARGWVSENTPAEI